MKADEIRSATNAGGDKEKQAETKEREQTEAVKNDEVSYGQFASGEELFKAYKSLQSQFTRRSQRLRELERENQSLKEQALNGAGGEDNSCGSCYEQGGKPTEEKCEAVQNETGSGASDGGETSCGASLSEEEEIAERVEKFLRYNPRAASYAAEIAAEAADAGDAEDGFLERAFISALLKQIDLGKRRDESDDYIFERASRSPAVKERLIREYLGEIIKNPSVTLISRSGLTATTPPLKPKDIEEAGRMAAAVLKRK